MKKNSNEDFTDKEFDNLIKPYIDKCNQFFEDKIAPEYCAYDVKTGYEFNVLFDDSLELTINSSLTIFNIPIRNKKKLKQKVIKILKNKYGLILISEKPIKFKK